MSLQDFLGLTRFLFPFSDNHVNAYLGIQFLSILRTYYMSQRLQSAPPQYDYFQACSVSDLLISYLDYSQYPTLPPLTCFMLVTVTLHAAAPSRNVERTNDSFNRTLIRIASRTLHRSSTQLGISYL